jgi:hypothetical protein
MKTTSVIVLMAAISVAAGLWVHAQSQNTSGALTTQDYIEIQQLYASLARGLDSAEADGYTFAKSFIADGVQGSLIGQKALAEFAVNWHERRNGANVRHSTSNLVITPTPEGANASAYLLMLNVGERPITVFGTASENDVLVKTPQGWRFKTRSIRPDAPLAR